MGESTNSLESRISELHERPATDHALVAAVAAEQAIPGIGGVIATFISEYVPRRKQARLVSFVEDLGRQFQAEREHIDEQFVHTDEFAGMVEDVLDRVPERKNEEKFHYWAKLLAGMITMQRPPKADRERMIDTLDALRSSHLQLLHLIATTWSDGPSCTPAGSAIPCSGGCPIPR